MSAFGVNFYYGGEVAYNKDSFQHVRAVRGKNCRSTNTLVLNNTETVIDICTGLMWQRRSSSVSMTWEKAIEHCESLSISGYSDWRLPTIEELRSIVDLTKSHPAINEQFYSINYVSIYEKTRVVGVGPTPTIPPAITN